MVGQKKRLFEKCSEKKKRHFRQRDDSFIQHIPQERQDPTDIPRGYPT